MRCDARRRDATRPRGAGMQGTTTRIEANASSVGFITGCGCLRRDIALTAEISAKNFTETDTVPRRRKGAVDSADRRYWPFEERLSESTFLPERREVWQFPWANLLVGQH
ncbi:uncharacterized protein LOC114255194 [Monomorium pharaonis]|uniref:uncharacterized protein LOC114255194 n=1 Tax=Monomorium pharaonis TaxID=307658 RepID=UPI0017472590|nr:uncharacterized protein LOC114255194 [Monomorium pharaonis]